MLLILARISCLTISQNATKNEDDARVSRAKNIFQCRSTDEFDHRCFLIVTNSKNVASRHVFCFLRIFLLL